TATTMNYVTASAGIPAGCASAGTHYDVWYKFTATGAKEFVSLSGLGLNLTNPEIQLYSGSCGTLTSVACGTTSLSASGLTNGSTYFIRVSNVGSDPTGAGTVSNFSICVYAPPANDDPAGATT